VWHLSCSAHALLLLCSLLIAFVLVNRFSEMMSMSRPLGLIIAAPCWSLALLVAFHTAHFPCLSISCAGQAHLHGTSMQRAFPFHPLHRTGGPCDTFNAGAQHVPFPPLSPDMRGHLLGTFFHAACILPFLPLVVLDRCPTWHLPCSAHSISTPCTGQARLHGTFHAACIGAAHCSVAGSWFLPPTPPAFSFRLL
jgi:hypothetical protein